MITLDKFKVEDKGYSVSEVNKFVDDVIAQTEGMLDKMKKLHDDNEKLKSEIVNYKKSEGELKRALYKAEEASTEIRKSAYEERNSIIDDARKNASRIVNDALLRAEKIEIRSDTLEKNMRIFKRKLKLVVEQQLAVIDEIEELKLK